MADVVQYRMERMVDELDDLERRGLFTRREIAEIVKKRRDFEYRLKRRCPLKQDFLSYADYESQLDSLRSLRKRAIIGQLKKQRAADDEEDDDDEEEGNGKRKRKRGEKLWKRSISDTAGARRIMDIYRRVTLRFKGDLSLWFRYLEFCRSSRNGRMKQVLVEAIRFHPKVPGLWIYAAAWEFDENLNVAAARALMQGGLRACPDSEDLWIEYLRMELTYLNKLKARKAALGEDVSALVKNNGDANEISDWKEENKDLFMPLNEEKEEIGDLHGREGAFEKKENFFWEHSSIILQTIYHGAVKAIPSSMSLRKRFLEILEEVNLAHSNELKEEVMKDLRENFSRDPYYWDWLARFQVHRIEIGRVEVEGEVLSKLNEAIQIYEEALGFIPSIKMFSLYTVFLLDIVAPDLENPDPSSDKSIDKEFSALLPNVFERAELSGCLNEDLAHQYMLFYLIIGKFEEARELAQRVCCNKFPESARLWVLKISIQMKQLMSRSGVVPVDDLDSTFELLRSVLTKSTLVEANALCFMSLKFFSHRKKYFNKLVDCLLILFARSGGDAAVDGVSSTIVDLVLQRDGVQHAREIYKRFLALPHPSLSLFRHCIELESNLALLGDSSAIVNARNLYESALNLYGTEKELWRNYYSMETKIGTSETVNAVFWRAHKALGEASDLSH